MDFLIEILKSAAGSFAFVFVVLSVAFWSVYKIAIFNVKVEVVDKIEGKIDAMKDDISMIKAQMDLSRQTKNRFAKSKSPVTLTPEGEDVSKDLEMPRLVEENWPAIERELGQILEAADSNPYDIQQGAITVGGKFFDFISKYDLDKIKRYAYDKGDTISQYDMLVGVHIRDSYFRRHKIELSEVDKHDPGKQNV